jgi:hypothetical protein
VDPALRPSIEVVLQWEFGFDLQGAQLLTSSVVVEAVFEDVERDADQE